MSYYFKHLIQNMQKISDKNKARHRLDMFFLKKFWSCMIVFKNRSLRRRQHQIRADEKCVSRTQILFKEAFEAWWRHSVNERRNQRIVAACESTRTKRMQREFWVKLLQASRAKLKFDSTEYSA